MADNSINSTPQRRKRDTASLAKFCLLKSSGTRKNSLSDLFCSIRQAEFNAIYCGFAVLDDSYTDATLRWIIPETAQFKPFGGERVRLKFYSDSTDSCLKMFSVESSGDEDELMFEHEFDKIVRVCRCVHDKKCFAYLTRTSAEFPVCCHVFLAADTETASEFCTFLRTRTSSSRLGNNRKFANDIYDVACLVPALSTSTIPSEPLSNYLQFEVLYVCRAELKNQKLSGELVDRAVFEFKHFKNCRSLAAEIAKSSSTEDRASEKRRVSMESGRSLLPASPTSSSGIFISSSEYLKLKFRRASHPQRFDAIDLANDDSVFDDAYHNASSGRRHEVYPSTKEARQLRPRASSDTRVMLLLIGRVDVCLLSLDKNKILTRKKLSSIIRVVQGCQQSNYFAFECDVDNFGYRSSNQSTESYVFRCQNPDIALNIMQTMRTAFYAALADDVSGRHVLCDACPLRQYALLCQDLEGLNVMQSHELILQRIGQLHTFYQENVWIHYKNLCGNGEALDDIPEEVSTKEIDDMTASCENSEINILNIHKRNVTLMYVLRSLCEKEQSSHVHTIITPSSADSTKEFLDCRLSSSQENIFFPNSRSVSPNSRSVSPNQQLPQIRLSLSTNSMPTTTASGSTNKISNSGSANNNLQSNPVFNLRPSTPTNKFLELRDRAKHSLSNSLDSFLKSINSSDTSQPTSPFAKMVCHFETLDNATNGSAENDCLERPRSSTVSGEFGYQKPNKAPRVSMLDKLSVSGKERIAAFRTTFDAASVATLARTHNCGNKERRMSWRQAIFSRVVSPRMLFPRHSVANVNTLIDGLSPSSCGSSPLVVSPLNESFPKTALYYRSMWKKAIMGQILIMRIEQQKKLQGKEAEALRRLKLNYEEITPCSEEEVRPIWTAFLNHPNRQSTRFDRIQIEDTVRAGIPKDLREDVWRFLLEQQSLDRSKRSQLDVPPPYRYKHLLKDLTSYQHAILIDLGRTFPGHPYFTQPLGSGQLSLFNILKAYSLFDPEVGYCQGLSFVAGLLLLHMEEEHAFDVLVDLLYRMGLRKQYRPDMLALQIEMYQLSRLVHDKHKDLHEHLEEHEIPVLYAAPWFLTLFASAFPLGFVARVFDFVFLAGSLEVVFKIALVLLGEHKELIKQCDSFEAINEFLKNTLPSMSIIQMERIFNQVTDMDISRELLAYEVEYHVLQEEMMVSPLVPNSGADQSTPPDVDVTSKLASVNKNLKRQNLELLEKLQQFHSKAIIAELTNKELESKLSSTHNTISSYKCKVSNLENRIETLELERKSLLTALQRLRLHMPALNEADFYMCGFANGHSDNANYDNLNDSSEKKKQDKM